MGDIRISDVYSANKYNLFVTYCVDNNMTYMDDLKVFDFNNLTDVHGIGKGKIRSIIDLYASYCNGEYTFMNEDAHPMYLKMNDELAPLELEYLLGLGIRPRSIQFLREAGYNKLGDLRGIPSKVLHQIVGPRYIVSYQTLESILEKNLEELLIRFIDASAQDENCILAHKKAEGYTLRELGDEEGLTRERIRQKINHFMKDLAYFIRPIIDAHVARNGYVPADRITSSDQNSSTAKLIFYWAINCDDIEYLDFANVFVPKSATGDSTEDLILQVAKELIGEGMTISENIDGAMACMKASGYPYMDHESFMQLMKKHGYELYGDYLAKGKQPYGQLCARVIAKKFPKGIKLYEGDDLNRLREYVKEEYGDIHLPDSDRALSTRLTEFLVLSGRGSVTAESNIDIDLRLLDEIKEYIDKSPEREVHYAEIYSYFQEELLARTSVNNYHYLHGVLKLYYGDDYVFSNRDYLIKKGVGYTSAKLSDKIRAYVEELGRPVTRKEIKEHIPGLTDIVLFNAVSADPELCQWDYNCFYSLSLVNIDCGEIDYLFKLIERLLDGNRGYCSENMLRKAVAPDHMEHLIDKGVATSNNLFYLCQKLFSSFYDFRRPHIAKLGLIDDLSVRNVALYMLSYPEVLSYRDYQDLTVKVDWFNVTAGIGFKEIEREYMRITDDLYVRMDKVSIDEDKLMQIEGVLRSKMRAGYVSLINFRDYSGLPNIGYNWNPYLIRAVIDRFIPSLRIIETKITDRRFEKGIAVDRYAVHEDYTDIVILLMKAHGHEEVSDNQLLKLLINHNLTYKMVPKEVFESSKIAHRNGLVSVAQ